MTDSLHSSFHAKFSKSSVVCTFLTAHLNTDHTRFKCSVATHGQWLLSRTDIEQFSGNSTGED